MLVDGLTPPKFGYIIGGSEVNPDDSERHKYMVSFNPSCSVGRLIMNIPLRL